MKELVEIPSDAWTLHGIVHVPAQAQARRVGVVIVQGPNTKFGTHRLFPQVAEALAQAGFYVLRYDNRGTCDSPGVCDLTFADRITDTRAAAAFFRRQFRLDAVLAWGLCMGAAVGIHCAANATTLQEKFDGLMLVNILAHPPLAGLPQQPYGELHARSVARNILSHGNPLRKLWKILVSRENWLHKGPALVRRYLRLEPALNDLRKDIGQVGRLLVCYEGPMLMLFGEKDRYWKAFREQVNPGDALGLGNKKLPPDWEIVQNGDHTFSSPELMVELLRRTTGWALPFLHGRLPGPAQLHLAGNPGRPQAQARQTAVG